MTVFNVKLKNYDWKRVNGTYTVGTVFLDGSKEQGVDLCNSFSSTDTVDDFINILRQINGFFAVVHGNNKRLFAAVDQIRSIPLFYGIFNKQLFLSDDAEWVRAQVGNTERDPLAETEFLLTGYVTGSNTLYPNVKQLQAGEALIAYLSQGEVQTRTVRYYQFLPFEGYENNKELLLDRLDQTVLRCISRLIEWADGRTIVIPLSAGYDSRLIALTLKRLGYKNVIAFTYGQPMNKEANISKDVANKLGIDWEFIPYTHQSWMKWFRSSVRKEYYRFAHNLSSLPHIQDWPAVWELKKHNKIPQDAVFVPGHVAGFNIGKLMFNEFKGANLEEKLASTIFDKHYSLWNWRDEQENIIIMIKKKIIQISEAYKLNTAFSAIASYNKWEWQERQAKLIVNSIRVYDFWGYEWWIPLWDVEMVDFWKRAPIEWRLDKKLYKEYVIKMYADIAKINKAAASITEKNRVLNNAKRMIRNTKLPYLSRFYYGLKKRREYDHPLAWYGVMDIETFNKYYTGRESINSFLVKELTEKISF